MVFFGSNTRSSKIFGIEDNLLFGQFKGGTLSPIGNHDYQLGEAWLPPLKFTK